MSGRREQVLATAVPVKAVDVGVFRASRRAPVDLVVVANADLAWMASFAPEGQRGPAEDDQRFLREVATEMREHHPASHPRHEMWDQMARLLEWTAALEDRPERVMAVARAYHAAVDRPDIEGRAL